MKTSTFFQALSGIALLTGQAVAQLPDKCPVVTLPEPAAPGNNGGGNPDPLATALQRCHEACHHLGEGCQNTGGQQFPKDAIVLEKGGCNIAPLGLAPPIDAMVSTLIVEPRHQTNIFAAFEGKDRHRVVIVRSRNLYNVFFTGLSGMRPTRDTDPLAKLRVPQPSIMTERNFSPLINGRTMTPGFIMVTIDGFIDGRPAVGPGSFRRAFRAMFLQRTTWDRDTHITSISNPGSNGNIMARYCTKVMTIFGQNLLHPVAKHGPVNDCIRFTHAAGPSPTGPAFHYR